MTLKNSLMLLVALFSFTVIGSIDEHFAEDTTKNLENFASQKFFEHQQTRLPDWEKHFKHYGRQYSVPWTLVAAVAYQESKWLSDAESYTGVKGLMQLTLLTAEHVGIEDREDPIQSIKGGTYYLNYLFSKSPKNLSHRERWAQALAAYNMGHGHLRDARRLASQLGKNPNRWKDLKTVIPLLEKEKYHSRLPYGYARGRETVHFVEKVFVYYRALNQTVTRPLLTSQDFLVDQRRNPSSQPSGKPSAAKEPQL